MAARVFVVNDTDEILQAFRDILEDAGYEVVLSGVAFRSVDEVIQVKPDLIILDYIFGAEKLGWQMLQVLRMRRETERIPVIVCTAATRDVRDIEGELMARGIHFLAKPFDIDELLNTVTEALAGFAHNALPQPEHELPDPPAGSSTSGKRSTPRRPRSSRLGS